MDKREELKGWTIPILGNSFVRLVDFYGSDQRIVEAARISYKSPSKGEEQDKKLLSYLYKNRHTSPFEQVGYTLNIKMPIFCMRQFVRHRTFKLNEVSGRYSELEPEFYIPTQWRSQDNKNKQGSNEDTTLAHDRITRKVLNTAMDCYAIYKDLLDNENVSKEMARFILPVNILTEIYVTCDLHNLMHFLRLRLDNHAQKEIQEIAQAMFDIMSKLFPWTAESFKKYTWKLNEFSGN